MEGCQRQDKWASLERSASAKAGTGVRIPPLPQHVIVGTSDQKPIAATGTILSRKGYADKAKEEAPLGVATGRKATRGQNDANGSVTERLIVLPC